MIIFTYQWSMPALKIIDEETNEVKIKCFNSEEQRIQFYEKIK